VIAAGITVSNERAVFLPISGADESISATARAFAAIASPLPVEIGSLYVPMRLNALGHGRPVGAAGANAPALDQAFDRAPLQGPGDPALIGSGPINAALPQNLAAPVRLASIGPASAHFYRVIDNIGTPANPSNPNGPTTPGSPTNPVDPVAPVPEPAGWAMMIAGLGLTGAVLRSIRRSGSVLHSPQPAPADTGFTLPCN
jgi:hypothetical protein